jgi:hypothetical protein
VCYLSFTIFVLAVTKIVKGGKIHGLGSDLKKFHVASEENGGQVAEMQVNLAA